MILLTLIFHKGKYLYLVLFGCLFFLVFQDQSRLQPWFYYYIFILGCIALYDSQGNHKNRQKYLNICRITMVGIYFWSGIQKVNYSYFFETFPSILSSVLNYFPMLSGSPILILSILSVFVEFIGGIGLLFKSTRKFSAFTLIGMHAFLLFILGPLGKSFNTVIWPWNVCFILLLVVLFVNDNDESWKQFLIPKNQYHFLAILLFLILPAFNLFGGSWDHYLSASLYSGKKPYAAIHVTKPVKQKFPKKVQKQFSALNEIRLRSWSYTELEAADYTEPRIYKGVFRTLCTYQEHKFGLVLEVFHTADLFSGERKKSVYFCHEV